MKKILVVDDEETFRSMVVTVLQQHGYQVLEAVNGMSAFEIAKAESPDLILSDVMMYSGSGFILREFLKQEPRTAKIPMVLMSGKAWDASAWGSDPDVEYLSKPFSMTDLVSLVERKIQTISKE